MISETVLDKIEFAKIRIAEIQELIDKKRIGTEAKYRQQLIQEVFFHSIGTIDYLAQLINEKFSLGVPPYDVKVIRIADELKKTNSNASLEKEIRALYINIGSEPFPSDPYSNYGLLYRLYEYRHIVTHRHPNPFHFILSKPKPYFLLNPTAGNRTRSKYPIDEDLKKMLEVVESRCCSVLNLI